MAIWPRKSAWRRKLGAEADLKPRTSPECYKLLQELAIALVGCKCRKYHRSLVKSPIRFKVPAPQGTAGCTREIREQEFVLPSYLMQF